MLAPGGARRQVARALLSSRDGYLGRVADLVSAELAPSLDEPGDDGEALAWCRSLPAPSPAAGSDLCRRTIGVLVRFTSASPSAAGPWLVQSEDLPVAAFLLGGRLGCFGLRLRPLFVDRRRGRRRANLCDLDLLVIRLNPASDNYAPWPGEDVLTEGCLREPWRWIYTPLHEEAMAA